METGHSVRYRNLMAGYRELPAKETILARIVLFVFVVPWTAYGLYQAFKRDVITGVLFSVVAVLLIGLALFRLRKGELQD